MIVDQTAMYVICGAIGLMAGLVLGAIFEILRGDK
jgi:hypothetical protein